MAATAGPSHGRDDTRGIWAGSIKPCRLSPRVYKWRASSCAVSEPWTERHRPQSLDRVLGNAQALADLRRWAQSWEHGTPVQRAVLLSGPPGCGKTTAALALAREFGWEMVELNASDARSAPHIQRVAGLGATHETFSQTGEYRSTQQGQRKLILLDEADNLYERVSSEAPGDAELSDRGGKRAIVETVLATRQPMVLIANDAYELLRGTGERLAKHLLRIPFRRPTAPTIKKRLAEVAASEHVTVSEQALQTLAVRARGDLRSALNDLEAVAQGRTHLEVVEEVGLGERNRTESAFDAVATILKTTTIASAIAAARDLDEPPDFLLAWLDENLPMEYRDPHDLAAGYEALARADRLLGRAQRRQQFALWGYATELLAGGVATAKSHPYGTPPRYQFPGWIRRMGATKAGRGVRDRLGLKIGAQLHLGADRALRDLLGDLRRLARGDAAFAEALSWTLELEEEEIRFLLGPDAPSAQVEEIVSHVEARRTEGRAQQRFAPHAEPAAVKSSSRHRSTRLGDF